METPQGLSEASIGGVADGVAVRRGDGHVPAARELGGRRPRCRSGRRRLAPGAPCGSARRHRSAKYPVGTYAGSASPRTVACEIGDRLDTIEDKLGTDWSEEDNREISRLQERVDKLEEINKRLFHIIHNIQGVKLT